MCLKQHYVAFLPQKGFSLPPTQCVLAGLLKGLYNCGCLPGTLCREHARLVRSLLLFFTSSDNIVFVLHGACAIANIRTLVC